MSDNTYTQKYKAIVFDMDGVLTETSHEHYLAWKKLANNLGYELPNEVCDMVRGISRRESLEIVLKICNLNNAFTESEKCNLERQKNQYYLDSIARFSPDNLTTGSESLLIFLKSVGFKIALASASKNANQLMDAMSISHYFDAVVDPSSIVQGKPAPDIFLKAAMQLHLLPGQCIGIEDAFAGIESIKAAGLVPIGIGEKRLLTNCPLVFSNLELLHTYFMSKSSILI